MEESKRGAAVATPLETSSTGCKGSDNIAHTQENDVKKSQDIAASNMAKLKAMFNEGVVTSTQAQVFTPLDEHEVSLSEKETSPIYLIKRHDVGALPLGNIVAVKGKAKSHKSRFIAIVCVVVLGKVWGDLHPGEDIPENICVAVYDTEQDRRDVISMKKRICLMLGWQTDKEQNNRLRSFNLRGMAKKDRRVYIQKTVETLRPQLIIIDGVRDLLNDINDNTEASNLMDWVSDISENFNACVVCVLHENKSKEDSNLRGAIGSELHNKMYDEFQLEKAGTKVTVNETDSRNTPWDSFSFVVDNDGIPHPSEDAASISEVKFLDEINRILPDIFKTINAIGRNDLERRYSVRACCSEKTASNRIKLALEKGILSVGDDNLYHWGKVG